MVAANSFRKGSASNRGPARTRASCGATLARSSKRRDEGAGLETERGRASCSSTEVYDLCRARSRAEDMEGSTRKWRASFGRGHRAGESSSSTTPYAATASALAMHLCRWRGRASFARGHGSYDWLAENICFIACMSIASMLEYDNTERVRSFQGDRSICRRGRWQCSRACEQHRHRGSKNRTNCCAASRRPANSAPWNNWPSAASAAFKDQQPRRRPHDDRRRKAQARADRRHRARRCGG